MSLMGALNVGKSALAVTQAQLQVTGNNIANAGNADYTRQVAAASSSKDQILSGSQFIGTGVNLQSITRQIDEALEGRLRGAISDDNAADTTQQWLGQVQSVFNELSDNDLSTQASTFFKGWSDLANSPQDNGLRQIVIQNGKALATGFNGLRSQLFDLQSSVNERMKGLATNANGLAQQVADLNSQIVVAEGGSGSGANSLRDARDAVIKQLSELMDVKTIQEANGNVNVYAGSEPLVIGGDNRGIATKQSTVAGKSSLDLVFARDGGTVSVSSGQLGALTSVSASIDGVADQVDSLANNLIFELNKVYSSGQGLNGFNSVTSSNPVDDATLALNDPKAGLNFTPTNGSFVVHVKDKSTGQVTSTLVQVDLDGLNGNDTTLNSLSTSLGAISGVQASISGGKLTIAGASSNIELTFSQDSSGALAAIGVNNYFTGSDASDIAVNSVLQAQPSLLAAAKNGQSGDNQTALAISQLESAGMKGLNGQSLKDAYQSMVNQVSVSVAGAQTNAEAAKNVHDTLDSQRQALSGVSLDEEAINLVRQQRAFQGAARLVSAVDELFRTLLAIT